MPKKYGLHFLEKWSRDEGDVCCCYVLHCFIASKIGMVVVVGFPAPLLPAAVEKKCIVGLYARMGRQYRLEYVNYLIGSIYLLLPPFPQLSNRIKQIPCQRQYI